MQNLRFVDINTPPLLNYSIKINKFQDKSTKQSSVLFKFLSLYCVLIRIATANLSEDCCIDFFILN